MDNATVQTYDSRAAEFASRYDAVNSSELQRLLLRYLSPGCRVYEIGCGTGRDAVWLASRGYRVTAVDASSEMLKYARQRMSATDGSLELRFEQSAMPRCPGVPAPECTYDGVVAVAVVMHIPDQELFEFAFQVRSLLKKDGVLILSTSLHRSGLNEAGRDSLGRLYRERPVGELQLLFERLGFNLVATHETDDELGRREIKWVSLVMRLESDCQDRSVDQIETIINRDKKDATYKLALLRSLCDIAQTAYHHVCWHVDGTVSVPLGLVAEKWLYYYWPLMDTGDGIIPQKRGREINKPLAFRKSLTELVAYFQRRGGLNEFHAQYQNERMTAVSRALTDCALNKIAATIVAGPVTYASQGHFSFGGGPRSARGKCGTPDGLLQALGFVHFNADVWRELCLVGHWISEAIIMRWADLTHEISGRELAVSAIIEKLLIRPETEREVAVVRGLFQSLTGLTCVWTDRDLAGKSFDVDHVIPFSLWHNNDLWNLLPAAPVVNNEKRDRLVAREHLLRRRERIIDYWKITREAMPRRFDVEVSRSLMGRSFAEKNWEKPAFGALLDAVEMLSLQRGIERWSPKAWRSGQATATIAVAQYPEHEETWDTDAVDNGGYDVYRPDRVSPAPIVLSYADVHGAEFKDALPLVADLAAGPLRSGFESEFFTAYDEFEWVKLPKEICKPKRFVVRVTGNSMSPTLSPGDLVVFEYHRTPRKDGEVVIAADYSAGGQAGEFAIKRYREDLHDWVFTSDNPEYSGFRYGKTQSGHPVVGTAVWNLTRCRQIR